MSNCRDIDPLVTPYVDRELPEADRQAMDEHLRRCPPCHSRVVAEQALLATTLAGVQQVLDAALRNT